MPDNSPPVYKDKNLRVIYLITLMAVLGVASITPAFPKISSELNISPQSVGLLIIFFTFPGVLLTPFLGVLADRFGRRKVLIPALLLFGIAGTACAVIKNYDLLLAFRFLQGIGAASLGSLNVTLIGDIYSGKRRAEAMGYNSSVLSIATASYPVIGGLLASFAWFYPFLLPVFALPIAFIVLFYLDNPEPQTKQDLKTYFKNIYTALNNRDAILYFAASLVTFIMLYGVYLTYFPFLLSNNYGVTPLVIGVMMSVMSVVTAVTSSQLGKLVKYGGEKKLLTVSYILYAAALLIIPVVPNIWMQIIPLIIFGMAHGINIPATQILLAGIAPLEFRGAFMSFNGMVLRLGQTLGPLIMGIMFTLGGVTAAFIAGAVLAACFFFLLLFIIRA